MKQFKELLIQHIESTLAIYEPYKNVLKESELKDISTLKSVRDILCTGNILDQSVFRKNEIPICEN